MTAGSGLVFEEASEHELRGSPVPCVTCMKRGDIEFAWSGDAGIAYQVVGDGALDLVYLPAWMSNLDWHWEYAPHARFLERLASFSRLIVVDRRGWGCSDRVTPGSFPPLEVAADDLIAVLDAVGSSQAAVFAGEEGGWAAMIAAATHPARFSALVLHNAAATWARTDETPWNPSPEKWQAETTNWRDSNTNRWVEAWVSENMPSLAGDHEAIEWLAKLKRGTIGPMGNEAEFARYMTTDIRGILSAIRVPTLVLYRPDCSGAPPENNPHLASRIAGSHLVELPGADVLPWAGESEALLSEVQEFLTGVRHVPEADRVLATLLFTDIIGSTAKAAELGDGAWKDLLARHDERAKAEISRLRGNYLHTTGDGLLATFDGPARAVRCSQAIGYAVRDLGLEIRAGCHTGEIELADEDVHGIAVHIAARIMSLAGAGEVFVSRTVKDLVSGSGLRFVDRGSYRLKGVPEEWQIYALDGSDESRSTGALRH